MARLTKWEGRDADGPRAELSDRASPYHAAIQAALRKLARYEDAEEQGRLVILPEQTPDIDFMRIFNLVMADAEDRVIVLPCKVGDELWFKKKGNLHCETVDRIKTDQTDEDKTPFCSIYTMSVSCLFEDIGRLVWLTREEAEKALEGIK